MKPKAVDNSRFETLPDHVLSVAGLQKTYPNGHVALHHADLQVRSGEIFALLGNNGAGKSTLINIVCGSVRPSAGKIVIGGIDALRYPAQARSSLGYMPQDIAVHGFLTVRQAIRYSYRLHGLRGAAAAVDASIAAVGLTEKQDSRLSTLSGGMKRRVMLAKALVHKPKLVFLDEPSAGVDPALRETLWDSILGLRAAGTAVVLTTHYLEEAERLADRVSLIANGRVLLAQSKDRLVQRFGSRKLVVRLKTAVSALPASLNAVGAVLAPGGLEISQPLQPDNTSFSGVMKTLVAANLDLDSITTSQSTLAEVIAGLTSEGQT